MSDAFLSNYTLDTGLTVARWFDGLGTTWATIFGSGTTIYHTTSGAVTVDTLRIWWHYGGAYAADGSPSIVSGAAAAFDFAGGNSSTGPWTVLLTDADPATTAGASYPGDFSHSYDLAGSHTYTHWRFRSTGAGNNDIYALEGGVPAAPPPDPEPGTGVDFDDDGFSNGDHDELADYVISWRIQRGASAEITGGASVGVASVELQNTGDRFNPRNTTGPLYGKLRDGKPMWIGVNSDGAASGLAPRGLFGGITADWTPNLVAGAVSAPTVTLTGEDALGWYRRTKVQVADGVGRSHDELRQALLDAADETRTDLAHEILTMPLSSWDGDLLSGLEAINQANGTRHFCKPEDDREDWYTYTTRNRQWRLDATIDASLDAGSDHVTGVTGMTLSADTVTNQQKASVTPVHFTPSSTTVWQAETLPFTFTGTKVIWVEFDDYVKDPTLDANFTGTTPTRGIEGFGRTAKITLVTAGTTVMTHLSVTGSLARRGLDESYVADATSSQAGTRGVRAGSDIGPQFVGILASARGIAKHVVWRYGDTQLRPTLVVENWIPEQFEIDLYDLIAFTTSQGALDAVLFEVVGLTHEGLVAASATVRHHVTTYVLQECKSQADPGWIVLDTSELDDTPILAY